MSELWRLVSRICELRQISGAVRVGAIIWKSVMSTTPHTPAQNWLKRLLPLAILLLGLILFFALGLDDIFRFAVLSQHYTAIILWVETHTLLAWGGFMLAYTLSVAFSLPVATLLTLAGGAVIGWPAVLLVVVSATTGALILFLAAKGALADSLTRKAGPFVSRIKSGFDQSPFLWLLALRLIPAAPFWVVNIVPAALGMKTRDFLAATFIGIFPGTSVYIWVGRGFDTVLASGQTPDTSSLADPQIILPLTALGCLALVPVVVKFIKARKTTRP